MANGDRQYGNQLQALYHLLNAHTTIGAVDGTWVECGSYVGGYLIVTGLVGGDTANLCISNAATKPADATHGVTLLAIAGATPTTWLLSIPVLPMWIKVQVTAKAAAAAVTAALLVRARV
jgi:hypothetical protein